MSFRSVFIAIVIGFGLVVAAFMINRQRPKVETDQPNASLVRATGNPKALKLFQPILLAENRWPV
jgi:hypothetical protein